MARHFSTALAVLACTLVLTAFASVGEAQLTVTISTVDGATPRTANSRYLFNKAECTSGAPINLTVSNIPTTTTLLDLWTGTDCNTVAARTPSTGACVHLDVPLSVPATNTSVTYAAGELTVADLGDCSNTASDGASSDVYMLAVQTTAGGVEDVGLAYYKIPITLDVVPPTTPSDVTSREGDTAVEISWSGTANTEYDVYVSTTGTSAEGGACGGTPSHLEKSVTTASATLNPSAIGLAIGETRSVAVIARDAAGNESPMSAVGCITRIETCGYFCQRGGGFSTCSAVPGAAGAGGRTGVALLATGLAFVVLARRRRSAR
jgi:hypothetical protein